MLQRLNGLVIGFVALLAVGCETEDTLEDVLAGSWDLHWKRCGVYYNGYDEQLFFSVSDTLNFGVWTKEAVKDTFFFEFNSAESILVDSSQSGLLNGVFQFSLFGNSAIEFEKPNPSCENELYRFE